MNPPNHQPQLQAHPPPRPPQKNPSPSLPPPKFLSKIASPKKAPEGTRPAKREAGQGELVKNNRTSRPTSRSTQPERTPQPKFSEITQTRQPRIPSISADLERRFRNLELGQKKLVEQTRKGGELEYLAVAKNGVGQYWITVKGTGKPFVREVFATPEFCLECAIEIEENFEILQVIELRPGETMERIGEMIGVWLERERVSRVWG
ncbi:hypothetical protein [Acaryochloris sp. 'Moss Beach']|uniref:hypothetical protein n=1 Tax=Acaryochloris sp. 'Moss Beach' TaxID=2740837 RepID=UPI0028F42D57|nr:hypothetical protein [Acaryochloris sp. 'Moss Beach']